MNNLNSYPVPIIDSPNWGEPLQLHLRQLNDPYNGGINLYEGDIPNTSLLKEGYTYIDTSIRALKRWNGTEMEILLGGVAVLTKTPEVGEYAGQIIYNTTEQAILQWVPNPEPAEGLPLGTWQYLVGGVNSSIDDPEIFTFEPALLNAFFFKLDPSSQWVNSSIPTGKLFKWTGFEWEQLLSNVPFGDVLTTQAGAAFQLPTGSGSTKLFTVVSNVNKATIYMWNGTAWELLAGLLTEVIAVNGNITTGSTLPEPIRAIEDGYKFYNTSEQNLKVLEDGEWKVLLQGVNSSTLQDIEDTIDDVKDELEATVAELRAELEALIAQLVKPGDLIYSASGSSRPGYLICNGAEYPITTYTALYNAIPRSWDNHPTLGLPSAGNFRVPDANGRALIGFSTARPVGSYGGAESVVLNVRQLPSHNHTIAQTAHSHNILQSPHTHTPIDSGHTHSVYVNWTDGGRGPRDKTDGLSKPACAITGEDVGTKLYSVTTGSGVQMLGTSGTGIGIQVADANVSLQAGIANISINNQGGGEAHNNMSPFLTGTLLIKT